MAEDRCSVVIADDAAEVRGLVRTQLNLSGRFVVVGEGRNGLEAIDLCREHQPDIALLDISMPEVDGLEALSKIRRISPQTRVVMYTGFDQTELATRARELGAAALIEKSAAMAELPDALDALRREHPAQPQTIQSRSEDVDTSVLDEHLERFREVFEEAAIGMATMTLTGRIVRANRALGELVGHTAHELVGMPYGDLAPVENLTDISEALHLAQAGQGEVVRFEHDVVRIPERTLLATAAPVRDGRGRPLYLFLQSQDVSAQRHAEEELRESEERFRLLVEAVQDYAIFMLDTTGTITSWNPGAQRIKQYASHEIIGKHFRIFYPPEVQAIRHPEHELELALRYGHYEEEGWRIRKDGSRFWASVLITAVHNHQGEHVGFAKVTRDIDERRQMLLDSQEAAAALARANTELEVANARLAREAADQAQFLAVTAHELRNPIGVLTGSAKLLITHLDQMTDAERAELGEAVTTSGARLQRLLRDLLTTARIEAKAMSLELNDVDVAGLVTRSVSAARSATPDVDIEVDVPAGLRVRGDGDKLAQLLDNLLGNALRYGAAPIRISARAHGGQVELTVSDFGRGVPSELRARLFDRFISGSTGTGTGLGLFIVRELARAHGGTARYETDAQGHPSFTVTLPMSGPRHSRKVPQ
ncbi:MAG TPA: PAS domain S-box protein [Jatrophihabitans sp.]|nr:PAS domain S-box protein [Jatrophihabitans sp.]